MKLESLKSDIRTNKLNNCIKSSKFLVDWKSLYFNESDINFP